eukprot:COSAG03_NODE_4445_length_1552_cov_10.138334_2_plen_193_part_00
MASDTLTVVSSDCWRQESALVLPPDGAVLAGWRPQGGPPLPIRPGPRKPRQAGLLSDSDRHPTNSREQPLGTADWQAGRDQLVDPGRGWLLLVNWWRDGRRRARWQGRQRGQGRGERRRWGGRRRRGPLARPPSGVGHPDGFGPPPPPPPRLSERGTVCREVDLLSVCFLRAHCLSVCIAVCPRRPYRALER